MAQPAPQKLETPTPDQTVTVTDGIASPAEVTIPSQGVVQFTADANDYLIELWDKQNQKHPAVCVFLGANSSIYLVGDPDANDHNSICPYAVKSYSDRDEGVGAGGGNKIIIGSGTE